jgi:acyl-coenzyme A thioesterase PaaI-like protein
MEPEVTAPLLNKEAQDYIRKASNPFLFKLGLGLKLPSALFWGLQIKSLSLEKCEVTIPFKWRTQNPFKSIYFAAMAGAAELSTGALCQLSQAGKGKYSMLVVDFRAEYYKKANQKITFTCAQGLELVALIDSLAVGDADKLTMVSTGTNPAGEEVAKFFVTWSFKRKA